MGLDARAHEELVVQVVGGSRVRASARDLEECSVYVGTTKDASEENVCYEKLDMVSSSPLSRRFYVGGCQVEMTK